MRRPPTFPLSLSIVLPCYREEANVERVVREAVGVGRSVAARLEVLVVDDGSDDRTGDIARALALELPELRVISHPCNVGYGAALASGFAAARHDWIFYTDGDGQFDLRELPGILPLLRHHDVISAFRRQRQDGPLRHLCGAAWTGLVDLLLDLRVRDVNCAFKVFPRSLFDHFDIQSKGAAVDAEVLAHARRLGLSIAQLPVSHRARQTGVQTGAHPDVIWRALRELCGLLAAPQVPLRPPPVTRPSTADGAFAHISPPPISIASSPRCSAGNP